MKASLIRSLFEDYRAELHNFLAVKFGDHHDAEDIVQDAFHNILRSDDAEPLKNPRAYLYRTTHNLALNRIRKHQRHENYLSSETLEDRSLPLERGVIAQADLEKVQASVQRLPSRVRNTFILSRVHGKTYDEIAHELQVSVSTVEKHIIRALRYLKDELHVS